MLSQTLGVLLPVAVFVVVAFSLVRLRVFSQDEIPGRIPLSVAGALMLTLSVWQAVKSSTAYGSWFLESIYPFLDAAQFVLLVVGLALLAVGLSRYAGFWQSRQVEAQRHDQKLALLDDLQRDARQPYQLLALLELAIKAIITRLPDCVGAVFLLNRSRRQFVLASAVGLTKDETAALEYYPLERNIVSQAVDVGEPLMAGGFDFARPTGGATSSRFNSCLVLPMISGMEKIGGMILLSEQSGFFGGAEIRLLAPVAEWLAEKIKSARLTRELSAARTDLEKQRSDLDDLAGRLAAVVKALASAEPFNDVCRALVGAAASRSVHLYGFRNGVLQFDGGSDTLESLSESYRTALVEALDRDKPLLVNQEAQADDGRTFIAVSSLIVPLPLERREHALLLRRESGQFVLDAADLKSVGLLAALAALAYDQHALRRSGLARRKGIQAILQLLRLDRGSTAKDDWIVLGRSLGEVLPEEAASLILMRTPDGQFRVLESAPGESEVVARSRFLSSEADIAAAVSSRQPMFAFGRRNVLERLEAFEPGNRQALGHLFGSRGSPVFMATCPITDLGELVAVTLIFLFNASENERGEWERLLTLTFGLYSMRLAIRRLTRQQLAPPAGVNLPDNIDEIVNRLNNHLSGVLGNADLASQSLELPATARVHIGNAVVEAERAADYLRRALGGIRPDAASDADPVTPATSLAETIADVLKALHISENVYMIAGSPREVELSLESPSRVALPVKSVQSLFEQALERFAAVAPDEDLITVTVYQREDFAYLDISCHQRNLPAIEPVAGFGQYHSANEVLSTRPAETFLKNVTETDCAFSFDRFGGAPTYFSFRFPVRHRPPAVAQPAPAQVRVLAIDDQPVILDLISAMCQSMGFGVQTVSSGEEGVRMASRSTFDIVLTDLAMPGMSGLEVARRIRHVHPHTPIVLVTGWEVNVPRSELEAAGVSGVLYKPFRIEQLTETIQGALSARSVS